MAITINEMREGFRFSTGIPRSHEFGSLIIGESNGRGVTLDIGCGAGICRSKETQINVSGFCDEFWGVEPDNEVIIDESLFSKTWRCNLERADIPENCVALAYAAMVIEHVENPDDFLRKVYSLLVPGGKFLAVTISGWSYLGIVTMLSERLHIQEILLSLLVGSTQKNAYHYPAVYRMNTERRLRHLADNIGFSKVLFAYTDNHSTLSYWPKGFKWMGYSLDLFKKASRRKQFLNNMYIVFQK